MDLKFALDNAVIPALKLLPPHLDTPKARVLTLAIGLQESRFEYRVQMGNGPAHSFWQMEEGGGVKGVCRHHDSIELARLICRARDCNFDPHAIWAQLANDDILGAAFARLLLLTDPQPLPEIGDAPASWDYYQRNWRPGKPRRDTWDGLYARAVALVQS